MTKHSPRRPLYDVSDHTDRFVEACKEAMADIQGRDYNSARVWRDCVQRVSTALAEFDCAEATKPPTVQVDPRTMTTEELLACFGELTEE